MPLPRLHSVTALFHGQGLRALALRGAVWTVLGFGLSNLLRLGSSLALTRILAPDIFGLMALAMVFVTGLTLLSDVGTTASVVRSDRGEDPSFLRTVWTVQVLRGFLIAAIACLAAWPLSQLYGEPVLFPLICVLALTPAIKGFQSVSLAVHTRKMDVFRLTVLTTTVQAVTIGITVAMAFVLESVWALALGTIAGSLLTVAMSHVFLSRFAHRFSLERDAVREIIRFGRWILLGTLCTYVGSQGAQALQGALVPLDVLGLIAIAMLMGGLPGQLMLKILGAVAFPTFSRIRREEPERLGAVLLKVRVVILCITFPLFFGLALLAQPIIDLLYDPRYAAAGFILALLLAEDAISALSAPYQNLLLADGNSRAHALVMGFWALARSTGLFVGFSIAGMAGMLAGMAIGSALMFLLSASIAWRNGYASKLLDLATLAAGTAFYIYIFLGMEVPPQLSQIG